MSDERQAELHAEKQQLPWYKKSLLAYKYINNVCPILLYLYSKADMNRALALEQRNNSPLPAIFVAGRGISWGRGTQCGCCAVLDANEIQWIMPLFTSNGVLELRLVGLTWQYTMVPVAEEGTTVVGETTKTKKRRNSRLHLLLYPTLLYYDRREVG